MLTYYYLLLGRATAIPLMYDPTPPSRGKLSVCDGSGSPVQYQKDATSLLICLSGVSAPASGVVRHEFMITWTGKEKAGADKGKETQMSVAAVWETNEQSGSYRLTHPTAASLNMECGAVVSIKSVAVSANRLKAIASLDTQAPIHEC